jgi:hypothetical protein
MIFLCLGTAASAQKVTCDSYVTITDAFLIRYYD